MNRSSQIKGFFQSYSHKRIFCTRIHSGDINKRGADNMAMDNRKPSVSDKVVHYAGSEDLTGDCLSKKKAVTIVHSAGKVFTYNVFDNHNYLPSTRSGRISY